MTASARTDGEAAPDEAGQGDQSIDLTFRPTSTQGPRKITETLPSNSRSIDDLDTTDLMAAIREVFSPGAELDRDSAIREVAHTAGFNRTGSRIADEIDSALITAVKRGIIKNHRGLLSMDCRDISQYPRDLLVSALVAATGYAWTEREDAIRAAARHLGFRRTGSSIHDAFKSAINSAIRRGLIDTDGKMIRKSR